MQLTITIASTFDGPDIRPNTEDEERDIPLDVPDHLLERFLPALRQFAASEIKASCVEDFVVVIPYRMSWDPVSKLQGWFKGWLQEANTA